MQVTVVDGARAAPKDSGVPAGNQTGAGGFDTVMADVFLALLGASPAGEQDPGGTGAGSVSMVDVFPLEAEEQEGAISNAEAGDGDQELAQTGNTRPEPAAAPGEAQNGLVITGTQAAFAPGGNDGQAVDQTQKVAQEMNAGAPDRGEHAARAAAKAEITPQVNTGAASVAAPQVDDTVASPVSTEGKPPVPDISGAVRANPTEGDTSRTAAMETVRANGVNAPAPAADGKLPAQDLMEMPEVKDASAPGREKNAALPGYEKNAAESKNTVLPGRAAIPENLPPHQLPVNHSAAGATAAARTAAHEAELAYGPAAPVKAEPAPDKGVFAVVPDKAGIKVDAGEQPVVAAAQQPDPEFGRQSKNENMAPHNGPGELKAAGENTNVKAAGSAAVETEPNVQTQAQPVAGKIRGVTLTGLQDRVLQEIKQVYNAREGELQTRVQLKLEPEHLGQLTIKLYFQKGELNAHFYTANNQVKEVLEGALQQLRDSLGQQDLRLNETFVFVGNGSQDNPGGYSDEKYQSDGVYYGSHDYRTDGGQPAEHPEGSQTTTAASRQVDYLV